MEKIQVGAGEAIWVLQNPYDLNLSSWNGQRTLYPSKVDELVNAHKAKTFTNFGVWTVCRKPESDILEIIDGQHRWEAYKILFPRDTLIWIDQPPPKIVLHVFDVTTDEQTFEKFKEFNKSTPVPAIYFDRVSLEKIREIIAIYREKYVTRTGNYRCRVSLGDKFVSYLAEALYDEKEIAKVSDMREFEEHFVEFANDVKRILTRYRIHIAYMVQYVEYADFDAYFEEQLPGCPRAARLITLLLYLYPTLEEVQKQYGYAETHNSYIGIFAWPWADKPNFCEMLRNAFWKFVQYRKKSLKVSAVSSNHGC